MHSTPAITHCPICQHTAIQYQLSARDNTVSKEIFEIWGCNNCRLRFTQSAPDAEHIGAYYQSAEYISHSNTQQGLVNRLYHLVRKITLAGKARKIARETGRNTGKLLDIGAGTGAFAATMQQAGWQVTGLEPDSAARETARNTNGVQLLPAEELYQLPRESFDVITLWHVLEHVHDLHGYLKQLGNLLKADGLILIAVPNYTSHDAHYYGSDWAAYDVPRHLYHFAPESMQQLVELHQLRLVKKSPMWFDSFYVSMLSEKYRSGKSRVLAGAWQGLLSNCKAIGKPDACSSLIYLVRH